MVASKEQKRREADERNAKWAALSAEQQLAQLDKLFGEGKGAAKQRVKIAKRIEVESAASAKKGKKKTK